MSIGKAAVPWFGALASVHPAGFFDDPLDQAADRRGDALAAVRLTPRP
ncbi:hypothetical protein [Nocardia shimofusensis]|nr:hypothetical protein [Nocardia shimofusensis]